MAEPALIAWERITRGTTFKPYFVVRDADGEVVNLASGTVECWLNVRAQGSTGSATTRTTATAAHYEWVTDGTDGQVRFIFDVAATLAMTLSENDVELFYSDTSTTPDDQLPKGRGIWFVEDPTTTTLTAP